MKNEQATGDRQRATGNEMRKGGEIANRLLRFGADVVNLARTLPNDFCGRHIAGQIVRSSTSGGANYEEARAAESRADFSHKLGVAAKELRESIYWLRLIQELSSSATPVDGLIGEACALAAILVASARTARRSAR